MRCELIRSIEERSRKIRLTARLLGPLVLLLGHVTAAPAQSFTVFDAPGTLMVSSSINAKGTVTGYFEDLYQFDKRHGFVRDPFGNFTVFDAPGSFPLGYGPQTQTFSTSINAGGAVTGYFIDPTQGLKTRGFVRDAAGNFTVSDPPNAADFGTVSASINARGDITGYFNDVSQNLKQRGFVMDR